jgi:hypothetical protein
LLRASVTFYAIIVVRDRLFSVVDAESDAPLQRFLRLAQQLPMDLQWHLAKVTHATSGLMGEHVPSEAGLQLLFDDYYTAH